MQREINIEKLAYGGEGIGKLDSKICFIKNALPGETILAEITEDKKKFFRGKMVKVLKPSPARVTAPCMYAAECDGCQYQHLAYEEELRWKEIQVREYFQKQLKLPDGVFTPIISGSEPYGYRGSMSLHVQKDKDGTPRRGLFGEDNVSLIPIQECLLARPALQSIFQVPIETDTAFRLAANGEIIRDSHDKFFEIAVGPKILFSHSKGFIQNNADVTYKTAMELKAMLDRIRPDSFADLYSGLGTFTFLAAGEIPRLLCAEENPFAVKALRKNMAREGKEIAVLEGPVEKTFPKWMKKNPPSRLFVFLDPPRKGMAPGFPEFLGKMTGVSGLAYLSCHLGTVTRDLELILKSGKWKVSRVTPFDMFPRTKHIEILVLLEPAG